jgi:hypothetical protein
VTYVRHARTVEPEKQPLLNNTRTQQYNNGVMQSVSKQRLGKHASTKERQCFLLGPCRGVILKKTGVTRQAKVTLRLTVSQSVSKSFITVWQLGLFLWGALSEERTGLSFVYAAGPCQRSLSRLRVTWYSRPYFTVSDLRLPFSSPPTTRRVTAQVFDPGSWGFSYGVLSSWQRKQKNLHC